MRLLIKNFSTRGPVLYFETEAGNFRFAPSQDGVAVDLEGDSLGEDLSFETALKRMLLTLSNYECNGGRHVVRTHVSRPISPLPLDHQAQGRAA